MADIIISGYPPAQNARSGCRVGWLYYADKSTAYQAAEIAKREACGDYGYVMPGSVTLKRSGEYEGLYEVCIP